VNAAIQQMRMFVLHPHPPVIVRVIDAAATNIDDRVVCVYLYVHACGKKTYANTVSRINTSAMEGRPAGRRCSIQTGAGGEALLGSLAAFSALTTKHITHIHTDRLVDTTACFPQN